MNGRYHLPSENKPQRRQERKGSLPFSSFVVTERSWEIALKMALTDYVHVAKDPWKKTYQGAGGGLPEEKFAGQYPPV